MGFGMIIPRFPGSARVWLAAAACLLLLPYGLGVLSSDRSLAADAVRPLTLTTTALPLNRADPGQTEIGRLRFMGALQIRSTDAGFGGISGLRADGRGGFLAVTDTGNWLAFRTVERAGRLMGIAGAVTAPIIGPDGRAATKKADADAESLEWNPATGAATVGFEQDHRLENWAGIDLARPETLGRAATRSERWAGMAEWPDNGGAEAFTVLPGGERLMISEDAKLGAGRLALLERGGALQRLSIPEVPEHRPTDAVALDMSHVLVLHRRFNLKGAGAALTLIDLGPALAGRNDVPSTELARWEAPATLDNMEGMAIVHAGGRHFVYLVSDDNLNSLQQTILMKFELMLDP